MFCIGRNFRQSERETGGGSGLKELPASEVRFHNNKVEWELWEEWAVWEGYLEPAGVRSSAGAARLDFNATLERFEARLQADIAAPGTGELRTFGFRWAVLSSCALPRSRAPEPLLDASYARVSF